MEYADPELRIAEWLNAQLDAKCHADPDLTPYLPFREPLGHVQRSPGEGDTRLSLDSVILDIDWYAELADHARDYAQRTWSLMRLTLPQYTWDDGVNVNGVQTLSAPYWGPATGTYRRSAAYRVFLHGVI